MGKVEINNEIILLRQSVRQARVCVINKLIREAKKLRNKKGNEKQVEKNKKKADKLLQEIYALKQIKDDAISRFGILNFDKLKDIIQEPSTDDKKRITAKMARYKALSARIAEFREKFPDYETYLTPEKKKKRASKQQKHQAAKDSSGMSLRPVRSRVPDTNSTDVADTRIAEEDTADESARETRLRNRKKISKPEEHSADVASTELEEDKTNEHPERDKKSSSKKRENEKEGSDAASFKVIGEQAAVKRFTDVLRDTNATDVETPRETSRVEFSKEAAPVERKVDDFFVGPDEDVGRSTVTNTRLRFREDKSEHCTKSTGDGLKARFGKPDKRFSNSARRESIEKPRGKGRDVPRGFSRNAPTEISRRKRREPPEAEKKSPAKHLRSTNSAESESLHPSWAARKKQQEIMKQGFQGKKIVFDED